MPHDFQPSRQKSDLADLLEMLLDKGVVINADIAVSIGDTQLLGIQVRAAIASFETAAKYGLEFPEGTDMRRVAEAAGEPELAAERRPGPPIDPTRGVNVTADPGEYGRRDEGEADADGDEADADGGLIDGDDRGTERLSARPAPDAPASGDVFEGGPLDVGDGADDAGDDDPAERADRGDSSEGESERDDAADGGEDE